MNRRRIMMGNQGGGEIVVPANQIWYDAESQITLYSQTNVVSHTFENGRGVVTFNSDVTSVLNWFRSTPISMVYFPSGVTSIGSRAFQNCTNLALTSLPSGVTSIGSSAFQNCTNLALTSLPSGVTSIESEAFQNCTNLALTSLPSGVTSIGSRAFYSCTNLALTSLPSGVTSIGSRAFHSCTNLALTSLPSGVTSIESSAFYSCTFIQSLTIPIVTPPTLGTNAFAGTSFPIYVPSESVDTYKAASGWDTYASRIFAIPESL